jgi:hypothetical protein
VWLFASAHRAGTPHGLYLYFARDHMKICVLTDSSTSSLQFSVQFLASCQLSERF